MPAKSTPAMMLNATQQLGAKSNAASRAQRRPSRNGADAVTTAPRVKG